MINAGKMRNVLTDPDRFFGELSKSGVNLTIPAGIVLIVAILEVIYAVAVVGALTYRFPEEALPPLAIALIAIAEIVESYTFWYICAVIFYVVSILFRGDGSFKRCLEFTGYGFIPAIVASVIVLAVTPIALLTGEFPVESPELMVQTLVPHLMQNSLIGALPVITSLLGLWGAYIWIFGIKHARNISTRGALITIGVPVGISIVCYMNCVYGIIII